MNEIDLEDLEDLCANNQTDRQADLTKAKQAHISRITEKHNQSLAAELRTHGYSLRTPAKANPASSDHTTPAQYKARMQALLHLIAHPEKARETKPLQKIWTELQTPIPYGKWVHHLKLGKKDKARLRTELKTKNITKKGALQSTSDIVRIVRLHADQLHVQALKNDTKASEHTITIDGSGSFWYKGFEFKKTTRQYTLKEPDKGLSIQFRHAAFDSFIEKLKLIDAALA